ncbi:MAG: baseplate J/gp47 family protein, partial [Paracoccus sp. (in: a-proteobacteria)]
LAGNGTHDYYISRAKAAHVEVIDVVAYRQAPGIVNVIVWGSDEAISAVRIALTSEASELLGVTVNVLPAEFVEFDISATVTVENHAPLNVAEVLETQLRAQADEAQAFGEMLSISQISAWLHAPDYVDKVTISEPMADIVPNHDALWEIGSVELEVIYD